MTEYRDDGSGSTSETTDTGCEEKFDRTERDFPDDQAFLTPEEIEEEQFRLMVLEAQREALEQEEAERLSPRRSQRRIPRFAIWAMALVLLFQPVAFLLDIYSLPAIDFLKTSAELSKRQDISGWKQAVAVVLSADGKGTGFLVSGDGKVITNHHVVQDSNEITVSFDEHGRFPAEVIAEDAVNDLAVLQLDGMPDTDPLPLSEDPVYTEDSTVRFIGNPLNFFGIANEGRIIAETEWAGRSAPVVLLDAPVYRGNSGSPVFRDGAVIGVIFAVTELDPFGKVGLFIRTEEVQQLLSDIQ